MEKRLLIFFLAIIFNHSAKAFSFDEFTFHAYIDGSYNNLLNENQFISGVDDRVFDLAENGFTFHQGAITLGYEPQGIGGLINVIAGQDAFIIAPYGLNPNYGSERFGVDPTQVIAEYKRGQWSFQAGLYEATCGAEFIDPTKDFNFSRSILDHYAQPFTFMGVRGVYSMNGQMEMVMGINNGWDSVRDTERRKTTEVGVTYNYSPGYSLTVTEYSGGQRAEDRTSSGPISVRNLLDMVATFNIWEGCSFVVNYDYGTQPKALLPDGSIAKAIWQGTAFYMNYRITDAWQMGLRGEIFDDKNGYRTGVVQTWKEVTLTLGYSPLTNLVIRGEYRHDFSSANSFATDQNGKSSTQRSFALEAFYKIG